MNGWQMICRQLEHLGVRCVFGLPGTQNAELFSELATTNIRISTPSSEKSAAFAAIGYAIGTGEPAVLLTIAGPGFCYTAAPLAEATHDSVPLINIVIGEADRPGRRFQLQQLDHVGLALRLSKAVRHVTSGPDLASALSWSWRTAMSGQPGPVVLIVDRAALNESQENFVPFDAPAVRVRPSPEQIEEVLERVSGKRVLILAGRGAAVAAKQIQKMAYDFGWPVMTTGSGRGVIDERDPWALVTDGVLVSAVNEVIDRFGVILAVGAKFTHNGSAGFGLRLPQDRLIHIDSSEDVMGANYPAAQTVCCDSGYFFKELAERSSLVKSDVTPSVLRELTVILENDRSGRAMESTFEGSGEGTQAFFQELQRTLPEDTIYVTDSGYHQVLARRYLLARHAGQLVFPSDFQSMGFGLPAGIGLALANPDKTIAVIHGDGGLQMCGMDMSTIGHEKLKIVICALDDGFYGLIRAQQLASGNLEAGVTLPAVNYESMADSFGLRYATSIGGLKSNFEHDGSVVQPVLMHQRVKYGSGLTSSFLRAAVKGRVRRFLGPELFGWFKSRRG